MLVTFDKQITKTIVQPFTIRVGIPLKGPMIPYLTRAALHQLVAFNSPISETAFTRIYLKFVRNPENAELIVGEKLFFGKGNHGRTILNHEGLTKFAADNSRRFKYSRADLANFMSACRIELDRIEGGETTSKLFLGLTSPTNNEFTKKTKKAQAEGLCMKNTNSNGSNPFFGDFDF